MAIHSRCAVVALMVGLALGAGLRGQEWEPITPEELALKDDPSNPGVSAVLLYRSVNTDDTKREETHLFRIKILKEDGKRYADIQISHFEKLYTVGIVRALVVSPDGKQVPFTGEIFDSVAIKTRGLKMQTKTFTFPGVQVGSIIEYAYRQKWRQDFPDVLKNPKAYLITRPITYTTARWTVLHGLSTRRARFFLRPLKSAPVRAVWTGLPAGAAPVVNQDGTTVLELQNLSAFREESHELPGEELKGRVDLYYYLGFWTDTDSFWWQQAQDYSESYEKFLAKKKAIEKAVAKLASPADSEEARLRKLYARAQQVRALSYERERTEKEEKAENLAENKSVEDILQRGYGWGNEINLFFVALARAAGFQADPIRVASRKNGFFRKNFPDESQLDAVVVSVRVDGKERFFDPATRYCPFDLLPWEETGTTGVRVTGLSATGGIRPTFGIRAPKFISTPPPKSNDAIIERRAALRLDQEGAAEGDVSVTFIGQEALERRSVHREANEAGKRKGLEDEVKGWLPAGATVDLKGAPNWEESDRTLRAEFHLKIPNWASTTGRRLLVPIALFQMNERHPFPNAQREHPIYFQYPFQQFDEVKLEAPEGFQVESLPEPGNAVFPFCHYAILTSNQGESIRLERRLNMFEYLLKRDAYPTLRSFYDRVRAGDEGQVVLRVIENAQVQ